MNNKPPKLDELSNQTSGDKRVCDYSLVVVSGRAVTKILTSQSLDWVDTYAVPMRDSMFSWVTTEVLLPGYHRELAREKPPAPAILSMELIKIIVQTLRVKFEVIQIEPVARLLAY